MNQTQHNNLTPNQLAMLLILRRRHAYENYRTALAARDGVEACTWQDEILTIETRLSRLNLSFGSVP